MKSHQNLPILIIIGGLLIFGFTFLAVASYETIELVSVASNGTQANDASEYITISGNGRYVAFASDANNLVDNDTNEWDDIFVHDRQTHQTVRVSIASNGDEADCITATSYCSSVPSISTDGRFVTFQSIAPNLVADDTNEVADIFVHDLQTGETTRVSVDSNGAQAFGVNQPGGISADGRYVAFLSTHPLVVEDVNAVADIFVHDRQTGETTRVSVNSNGDEANKKSSVPTISADGQHIAFRSDATNLVDGDTNNNQDIFMHNRLTGVTVRASVTSSGEEVTGTHFGTDISGDGRYVAFISSASLAGSGGPQPNLYIHDVLTGQTVGANVSDDGTFANHVTTTYAISIDGHYVVFTSLGDNLVDNDTNNSNDVFIRDLQAQKTIRVNLGVAGIEANGASISYKGAISQDNQYIVFLSYATNLIDDDNNANPDVFVAQFESDGSPTETPVSSTTPTVTPEVTETQVPGGTPTPSPTPTLISLVELIGNGGFELDIDDDKVPDNWTGNQLNGDKQKCNKIDPPKQVAYEGECAFQFKGDTAENSKLVQSINPASVTVNDNLVLSGQVKAKGSVNASVKLIMKYLDSNITKGKIKVKLIETTGDYTPLSGNLSVIVVGEVASIKLMLQNKSTSGKVWFDALSLQQESAASIIIPLP